MPGPHLSVLCLFYNEQAAVPLFFDRIIPILEPMGESFETLCVNDGRPDATGDPELA